MKLYATLNPAYFCGPNPFANLLFFTNSFYYAFLSSIPTVKFTPIQGPALFDKALEVAKERFLDAYRMYEIHSIENLPLNSLPAKGKFYIQASKDALNYWVLGLDETLQSGSLSWLVLPENFPRDEDEISSLCFIDKNYSLLFTWTALQGHTLNPKDTVKTYQKIIFELELDEKIDKITAFSRHITYKGAHLHPRTNEIVHIWDPVEVSLVNEKDLAAINALYQNSLHPIVENIEDKESDSLTRFGSFTMIN